MHHILRPAGQPSSERVRDPVFLLKIKAVRLDHHEQAPYRLCCQGREPSYHFSEKLSLADAFTSLKEQFGCDRLTVQSGGTVNGLLLREKLFDFVDLVVSPVLIGGKDTATLIDGPSLRSASELSQLGVLRLIDVTPLKDSYLRLRYQVIG